MLVKVTGHAGPRVAEVAIEERGTVGEAIRAAGAHPDEYNITVTGVSVCTGTPLRPNDIVILSRRGGWR